MYTIFLVKLVIIFYNHFKVHYLKRVVSHLAMERRSRVGIEYLCWGQISAVQIIFSFFAVI